jgi:hypothetical protein
MKSGRIMRLAAAGLAITAIASACGDDDADSPGASDYCVASLALETAPEPDVDFETSTPEEITAATKAYASETFLPLAQRLKETAAEEIMDDIDIGMAGVNRLAETGDFEAAFGDPEFEAALERLHAHDLETCEWTTVDVRAADYAFQGVSSELDAGVTSFEFKNGGTEVHEMVVFRINDGVTNTVDELLAMPEEEVVTKTTMVTATGAPPGEADYAIADLTAGRYAMLCFVSEGTTSEDMEGTGQPHFMRGMVFEFAVA